MGTLVALAAIPLMMALAPLTVRSLRWLAAVVACGSWLQVLVTALAVLPVFAGSRAIAGLPDGFLIDATAAGFLMLTAIVCACALTHSGFFFARELAGRRPPQPHQVRLYYCFSAFFLLSMLAVFACDNLGYLWIAIEATTLLSAALVYFNRDKHAIEATWKYMIICSVGIAFALLGTVLIYAASRYAGSLPAGSLNVSELVKAAPELEHQLRRLGFIFCLLGYGTKAGMFPLHSWLPDAHSEAPAPGSAMLSGSLLNCALFAIYRLVEISRAASHSAFTLELIVWAGTVTVVAASLFLVRQHGLKRLWAYSSVENVGLMLVAIGLGSAPLFFLQALNHSVAKTALFLTSGNIIQMTGTKYLSELRGLWTSSPLWGSLLFLAAVAVTGIPPFGAFIPEWVLLLTAARSHLWVQFGLVTFGLALTFIAVIFHVGRILIGSPKAGIQCTGAVRLAMIPATLVVVSLILGITITPEMVLIK